MIAQSDSVVMFSVVSCWEATLKHRIGKMDICGTELWASGIEAGFTPIGLEISHIEQLELLPKVAGHRDPFDHLLLAQTKIEADALITHDRALPQYGIPCIGVR